MNEPAIMHIQRNADGTWFRMMAPFSGAPEHSWWREESEDGTHFLRRSAEFPKPGDTVDWAKIAEHNKGPWHCIECGQPLPARQGK